jgi:hypothetical protein
MKINEKLTKVIGGRTIELVSKEEGLVLIAFDDFSTMQVKVAGGPTMNMWGEGKIESAQEEGAEFSVRSAKQVRRPGLPLEPWAPHRSKPGRLAYSE